jgi:hypothetical protein
MAKEESEFQKLLSEAPAASDADTVTVMGALSRTADSTRFVLTLPDGRSVTLEVAAVKSAKKIAGAVGQSLVELELDAKRVPEKISENLNKPVTGHAHNTLWYQDTAQTIAYFDTHQTVEYFDHPNTGFKDIVGDVPPPTIRETIGAGGVEQPGLLPFAAAMPRQVDPATRAALEFWANPFTGTRTYFYNAYNWTADHHPVVKAHSDPQ